jgi:hypothetical protein
MYLLVAAVLALSGCASKLGYPARTVGIPTPVTLYSHVASKPSLTIDMPFGARDIWSAMYKKKFEDVLANIPIDHLKRQLDIPFSANTVKAKDLFAPSSSEVLDIGADYSKAKTDPPAYSGFDFSQVKESIPTQYVLALTIDDWGLIAAQLDKDNGPFVAMTIQLIDKDTNMSSWKYQYQWRQQVDKDANELTKPEMLEDILNHIIKRAVDQYFMWLGW